MVGGSENRQQSKRLFVPRTPRSRSAVWLCRFPLFFRPSLVWFSEFLNFFAFPGLSRLFRCCHFAQLQRCKVFSRLCFTSFRRLAVFIAIHAALCCSCSAYALLVCSASAVVAVSAPLALSSRSRSGLSGSSAAPYLAAISAGVSCRSVACSMISF